MGVSFIGIILVVLLAALFLGAVFGIGKSIKGVQLGHENLTCPNCRQETRADQPVCEKCGKDL